MHAKAALFATLLSLSGCMLAPYDNQVVSSTTSTVRFSGYHFYPNQPVYIQAKNFDTGRYETVMTVRSSSTVGYRMDGDPMYAWQASTRLPEQYWAGHRGGRAIVRALWSTRNDTGRDVSQEDGAMMSVNKDWYSCYQDNPTFDEFRYNCGSFHSPSADVYTSDYCATGPELNIVSVRADTDNWSTDLDYVVRVGDSDDRISAVWVGDTRLDCQASRSEANKFSCDTDLRDIDECIDRVVIEGFEVGSCGGDARIVTNIDLSDVSCSPGSNGMPGTTDVREICKSEPTPPGWIMVDDLWDPTRCGSPTAISYNVKRIVDISDYYGTLEVCSSEPVPTGWSGGTPYLNRTRCGHPTIGTTPNMRRISR